jgi:hypothetical protein
VSGQKTKSVEGRREGGKEIRREGRDLGGEPKLWKVQQEDHCIVG